MNYEARALSALLKNRDMVSAMSDGMGTLIVTHADVWDFVYDYYRKNKEVPPVSIVQEKFTNPKTKLCTFDYDDGVEGKTKFYIETLREFRGKTELERLAKGALEAIESGQGSVDHILSHFSKRTAEIQRATGVSRSVDVRNIEDASDHYDKVRELAALHNGRPGINTGFDLMDEFYPTGFAPGHFIVLLGYSGLGKTWFGIKLMINAWLQGYSPMIINLEMSPEELRDRIIFLISQYSMDDLVRANIDPDDFKRWGKEFMDGQRPFHLIGNEGFGDFTTDMVQAKIEQYKPDIVLADYLQLFTDRARSGSEIERAKRTAREFKQLAMSTNIPVMVITAVTGKDKKDRVNVPDIAQVAWSSEIEYAANLAFAVHTDRDANQKAGNTHIVGRKNRHGPLFAFDVKMNLDEGTILEIQPEPEADGPGWKGDENFDFLLGKENQADA